MKSNFRILVAVAAVAAAFGAAPVLADSSTATTTSGAPLAYRAPAQVDFRIVIPAFVYFQVGSATAGTIDTVTFSPTTADLGTANVIPGSQTLNVVLRGNNGAITIAQTNGGNLVEAGGVETISFATISTATSDPNLPAPVLSAVSTNTGALPVTAGKVTNRSAVWTYSYTNAAIPSAGTYGAFGNSGRVTYTAVMP